VASLLSAADDPLSDWLDSRLGPNITDKSIFASLTQRFEQEFHCDMEALNVLPADVLTRVSEYVPEVVDYIQEIVAKGFAYESNGSVYFDVVKFSSAPDHTYAKLVPEAVGDLTALAEGEGELSAGGQAEKRAPNDFALWKASKAGEPAWPSPWGQGRPGWHIECSVMACDILGEKADIHTGGVDLKFPHHDNEIAQAEARYGSDQWMSYFLHSGHLTIAGCKMSKSLKNFITIKQALEKHSARQLRLAFLLHSWSATLDYSEATMREAQHYEKMFNEFFLTVKDLVRKQPKGVDSYLKFSDREKQLLGRLTEARAAIHAALCDSVDTPRAMRVMKELVNTGSIYLSLQSGPANARLLHNIASYLTAILRVFGVISDSSPIGFPLATTQSSENMEEVVMPYLSLLAGFREDVRKKALEVKDGDLLRVCDELRDRKLGDLGVRMEDKEEGTVVKVVGRDAIQRERELERQVQQEKAKAKAEQKRRLEEAKRQREEQAAVPPDQMFRSQTDKYSKFDDKGIPTQDQTGKPLSDKQIKKLLKLWQAQEKKHLEHLNKM
jgi:cysteinyl-tRNA synthetase